MHVRLLLSLVPMLDRAGVSGESAHEEEESSNSELLGRAVVRTLGRANLVLALDGGGLPPLAAVGGEWWLAACGVVWRVRDEDAAVGPARLRRYRQP